MSRLDLSPFSNFGLNLINDIFNNELTIKENTPFRKLYVDLQDKGDHYLITADLPGFSEEQIKVEVEDDILSIQAEKTESKECEEGEYLCKERSRGSFLRRFTISGIDADKITGNFHNGVLELTLPKMKEESVSARRIKLSSEPEAKEAEEVEE